MDEFFESLTPKPLFNEEPAEAPAGASRRSPDPVLGQADDPVDAVERPEDVGFADVDPDDLADAEDRLLAKSAKSSGIGPEALERKGVNWATPAADGTKRTFSSDPGFYNVDYDPEGKKGMRMAKQGVSLSDGSPIGRDTVLAANVFGRQFSRDELMKDDEGRRLVTLMEKQRTGKYRDEGFWSAVTSFSDVSGSYKKALADVPFLGWMVDAGTTVGETISMSKAMRKMQNGEKVSDHEALAVRRYMLQQEMEAERGIAYNVGSLFHSSIPFMFEMGMASKVVASTLKTSRAIGAAAGGLLGRSAAAAKAGAIVGGAVGSVLATVLTAGGYLLGKAGRKGATLVSDKVLAGYASRTFAEGFDRATARSIQQTAAAALGTGEKELWRSSWAYGRERALSAMGRELLERRSGAEVAKTVSDAGAAAFARSNLTSIPANELRRRARFEAVRRMADQAKSVYSLPLGDAEVASRFLVNGDAENLVRSSYVTMVEDAALRVVDPVIDDAALRALPYWKRRKLVGEGFRTLAKNPDAMKALREGFVNGVVGEGSVAAVGDQRLATNILNVVQNARQAMGSGGAKGLVSSSIAQTLGGAGVADSRMTRQVLERLVDTSFRSLQLKYGATSGTKLFANSMQRLGGWFADGMLDGALRWDTSMFGGLGTIARSGSALGGKMGALKEALKVSFVEAPVRGAMQLGMQVPLWPAAAAAFGDAHDPRDFVVRGQLGIQAQALRTGDRELMDHARAIAMGSGLVEYVSENAGRGFNVFMSGIVKPTASALLPEPAAKLGSWMSRKFEAVFGAEKLMTKESQDMIAGAVSAKLGEIAARAGRRLPTVTGDEVRRFVAAKSAKGIAGLESFLRETGTKEGSLIRDAIATSITKSKLEAGILYFTGYEMMRRGLTPQKMVRLLETVGYDGIVAEMAEERYGGFFQGLLGLDESPSDSTWRDRVRAAFDGLFPSYEQLVTEALGFAIPSIGHIGMSHIYNRLGQGITSKYRRAAAGLNVGMNTLPEFVFSVDDPGYAKAVQDYRDRVRDARTRRFGTKEENARKVVARAGELFEAVESGKYVPSDNAPQFKELRSAEETAGFMSELAESLVASADSAKSLEGNLKTHDAEGIFGAEGVEAIRNMARSRDSYSDQAKEDFLRSPEYRAVVESVPLPQEAKEARDVDDVVNRIVLSLPVVSKDSSVVSEIRRKLSASDTDRVRANQYGDDLLTQKVKEATTIADALWRIEHGKDGAKGWLSRGVMRLVGAMDALVTGDLSLAARNPVQWALADESLPRDLGASLLAMKYDSVRAGMASVLARSSDALAVLSEEQRAEVEPLLEELADVNASIKSLDRGDAAMRFEYEARRGDVEKQVNALLAGYAGRFTDVALAEMDSTRLEEFERAGEAQFQAVLRDYMSAFLTAKNVLAVSRSDLSEAALQVVAKRSEAESSGIKSRYRYVGSDGREVVVSDFHDAGFVAANSERIEDARREIVGHLVRIASDGVVKVNTNARYDATQSTAAVIDYQRAMKHGTPAEILAAIQAMPAFAPMTAVHDASGGRLLDDSSVMAFCRTGDVNELLSYPVDRDLDVGQLRRVMAVMGRDFVFHTEAENQAAARQYLKELRIVADSTVPYMHRNQEGDRVGVTYAFSLDGEGNRTIAATVWSELRDGVPGGKVVAQVSGPDVSSVVDALAGVGVRAELRQVVYAKRFSVVSRDATSLALMKLGATGEDGRDAARRYYEDQLRSRGLEVEESRLPPWLRRSESDWLFQDTPEGREDAAAMMRAELAAAQSRDESEEAEAARESVEGTRNDKDEIEVPGYETMSASYLRSCGLARTSQVGEESTLLGGGKMWVMRPSALNFPDRVVLQSDFSSSGDSEAMLRAALEFSLHNAWRSPDVVRLSRDEFRGLLATVLDTFDAAAALVHDSVLQQDPALARRIEELQRSLGESSWRNLSKVSAVASALFFFTSERGLGETGNGFLGSPELAAVVDAMRAEPVVVPFLDAVDRMLGGHGLLVPAGVPALAGVSRVAAAFSPSGLAISNSRRTSLFNRTGVEGAAKPGIMIPAIEAGDVDMAEDGTHVLSVRFGDGLRVSDDDGLRSMTVAGILGRIADGVAAVSDEYVKSVSTKGLTPSQFLRMCLRSSSSGGESRARTVRVRPDAAAPKVRRIGGTVAKTPDAPAARPRTTDVISEVDAVRLGRMLSCILVADDGSSDEGRDDGSFRDLALAGRLSELDVRARVLPLSGVAEGGEAEAALPPLARRVRDFLLSRGMDLRSIDVVLNMLPSAVGNEAVVERDEVEAGEGDAKAGEAEASNDEADLKLEDGENFESWMEDVKTNAFVNDKSLMSLGRVLMRVFPSEKRGHVAIFWRLATELERLSGVIQARGADVEAPGKVTAADAANAAAVCSVARALNALRTRAPGSAASQATADSEGWDDPKVVDSFLQKAICWLADHGHEELAVVLNGLRRISDPVARAKALRGVAFSGRIDVNAVYLEDHGDGEPAVRSTRDIGSAATGSADSVRATLGSAAVAVGRYADSFGVSSDDVEGLQCVFGFLWGQFESSTKPYYDKRGRLVETPYAPFVRPLEGESQATHADVLDMRRRAMGRVRYQLDRVFQLDDGAKAAYDSVWKDVRVAIEKASSDGPVAVVDLETHDAVVRFARCLAERLAVVADAVDVVLGSGSELAYALRNPDIARAVTSDVESTFQRKMELKKGEDPAKAKEAYRDRALANFDKTVGGMFWRTFEGKAEGTGAKAGVTYWHRCPLFLDLVLRPLNVALREAIHSDSAEGDTILDRLYDVVSDGSTAIRCARASASWKLKWSLTEPLKDRLSDEDAALAEALSDTGFDSGDPLDNLFEPASAMPGVARTSLGTVFRWYQATMPRSTYRVSGRDRGQFRDSGQINGLPSSPPIMCMRLETALLPRLESPGGGTFADEYFANGSRFDDGTRLLVGCAGAARRTFSRDGSPVAGEILDKAFVPREVYKANVASFVDLGDMRNVRFQLYHGEKPSCYSVQIPHGLAEALYDAIRSKADWTSNSVTDASAFPDAPLASLTSREDRLAAYEAMFSVVASLAGCAAISPKRVQVLLAQGVPFTGHRDSYVEIETDADGSRREVEHTSDEVRRVEGADFAEGEPLRPATHFCFALSGGDATEDMGMYFAHGRIIEAQRGISTNPDAVSFKNHLNDTEGVMLTKGQCHAIGLGMYAEEDVPTLGRLREAQRVQRRALERTLGLDKIGEKDILDLPSAEDLAKAEAGDEAVKARLALREKAVALAERFFRFSSVVFSDMETQKAGPFGGRGGVRADSATDVVELEVGGKKFRMKARDKKSKEPLYQIDGMDGFAPWPAGCPKPEYGDGTWPVAQVVAGALQALGVGELDAEQTLAIRGGWVTMSGVRSEGTLADSGILRGDDVLSFFRSGDEWVAHYETRHVVGQIMANADATATSSHSHPAATNYVRDQVANQAYWLGEVRPGQSVPMIMSVARLIPQIVLRTGPEILDQHLDSDADFGVKRRLFPYSEAVREGEARKVNALAARAMRVYPSATHAVLVGSGRKAKLDRYGHSAEVSEAAGVTDFDRDALRPARVLRSAQRDAFRELYGPGYAFDRTYVSGLVNVDVSEDGGDPSFRYGWFLDVARLDASEKARFYLEGERTKAAYERYLGFLGKAFPEAPEAERVAAAKVAALALAAHSSRDKAVGQGILNEVFGECFTDYTGKYLNESAGCVPRLVALADLFVEKADGTEEFDFLALGIGADKRTSRREGAGREIYLGGSFFSGDRRPSGNFEAASGLARASAPVTVKASGAPGSSAMYTLEPVQSAVQGSDTDGDSATLTKMHGFGHLKSARRLVERVAELLRGYREENAARDKSPERAVILSDNQEAAILKALADDADFARYFEVVEIGTQRRLDLTERFQQELGNLLFQAQIDSYRRIETREATPARGRKARRGCELADKSAEPVLDVGFSGRDPVGPAAVFDEPFPTDASNRAVQTYVRIVGEAPADGMTYADAFKKLVNVVSERAGVASKFDILNAGQASFLTGAALDASGGRASIVSLQASIEHMAAYAKDCPGIRKLAPALYETYADEGGEVVYDPCRDFVSHLDGISNALFDVVKDLFAPRAGWTKSMLGYLVAKLVSDANAEYKRVGTDARFDNEWFFVELSDFANDFQSSPNSIAGLMRRATDGNNDADAETFGVTRGANESAADFDARTRTFRGAAKDALSRSSVLRWLVENVEAPDGSKPLSDLFDKWALSGEDGFMPGYRRWLRYMGACLNRSNDRAYGQKLVALVQSRDASVPDAMIRACERIVRDGGGANGGTFAWEDAAMRLVDDLYDMLCATHHDDGASGSAIVSHALFESAEGDGFGVAMYRDSLPAGVALENFYELAVANRAVSPEKAFRDGGETAARRFDAVSAAFDAAGGDAGDSFVLQMVPIVNRLKTIVNNQFSGLAETASVCGDRAQFDEIAKSNDRTARSMYLARCADHDIARLGSALDAALFVNAVMHGDANAPQGDADEVRRRLGPMLYTVVQALESGAYENVRQFLDTMGEVLPYLTTGFEVVNRERRRRAEAALRRATTEQLTDEAENGIDEYSEVLFDEFASHESVNQGVAATSILGIMIRNALLHSPRSDLAYFLANLNVTETNGNVKLESKLNPEAAKRLGEGFRQMRESTETVPDLVATGYDSERKARVTTHRYSGVRFCDVAFGLQLLVCANQTFDAVSENDTKVDVSSLFDDVELFKMGEFGAAATHTFVGRALCRVKLRNGRFDLLRRRDADDKYPGGPKGLAKLLVAAFPDGSVETNGTAFIADAGPKGNPRTPLEILVGMVAPGYVATEDSYDLPLDGSADPVSLRRASSFREALARLRDRAGAKAKHREDIGLPTPRNDEYDLLTSFAQNDVSADDPAALDRLDEGEGFANTAPFRFVGANDDMFDSVEAALNSYGTAYAELLRSEDQPVPTRDGDQPPPVTFLRYWLGRYAEARQAAGDIYGIPALVKTIFEETRAKAGEAAFREWVMRASMRGGLTPTTAKPIRDEVRRLADEYREADRKAAEEAAAEKVEAPDAPRARFSKGSAGSSTMLARSGVAKYMKARKVEVDGKEVSLYDATAGSVLDNLTFAFQVAFGPVREEDGVKKGAEVTQLVAGDVLSPVFRITRHVVTKEPGKGRATSVPVVTYVSFGEALSLDADTREDTESVLVAVNEGREAPLTTDDLMSLTPEQRRAFARANGLQVLGRSETSVKGVTTNALLALTGVVRLGQGSDYQTVFHEYFHQMVGYCRRVGLMTRADEAALAKAFGKGKGGFNEEAAAEAYGEFVRRAAEGALEGKLLKSGFGGDVDRLFRKFREEAQRLLAGATAFDAKGRPAFLTMLVTGDFSARASKRVREANKKELEKIEKTLLGEEVEYDLEANWQKPEGKAQAAEADVVAATKKGTIEDIRVALEQLEKDKGDKPVFEAKTVPFGNKEGEPKPEPKPEPAMSASERELEKIWDDQVGTVPEDRRTMVGEVFSGLTGESSFRRPRLTPEQIAEEQRVILATAANHTLAKRRNPANRNMKYDQVNTFKQDSDVMTWRPRLPAEINKRNFAAQTNFYDKATGKPKFKTLVSPKVKPIAAQTITNVVKFVNGDYSGITNGIPAEATAYYHKGHRPPGVEELDVKGLPPEFNVGERERGGKKPASKAKKRPKK